MDWKRFADAASYYQTLPWRESANRHVCEQDLAPICVLSYHRVANSFPDERTVSPSLFERQLDWLQERCDLISLHEAQYRIRVGRNDRPAVCITFDDGYSDNCHYAIPLLVERKIPCTYFVALDFVLFCLAFPHDVRRGFPLEPNSVQQLKKMAADGIEIGAHSRTHVDLRKIKDPAVLIDEIVTAGRELEALVEQRINYFAFPYGHLDNLTATAFRVAREAGYAGVVSAYGGCNFPGDDEFHLQRIQADKDMIRFRKRMTVDPRPVGVVEPLPTENFVGRIPFTEVSGTTISENPMAR